MAVHTVYHLVDLESVLLLWRPVTIVSVLSSLPTVVCIVLAHKVTCCRVLLLIRCFGEDCDEQKWHCKSDIDKSVQCVITRVLLPTN